MFRFWENSSGVPAYPPCDMARRKTAWASPGSAPSPQDIVEPVSVEESALQLVEVEGVPIRLMRS